jgi:hypothetical protein
VSRRPAETASEYIRRCGHWPAPRSGCSLRLIPPCRKVFTDLSVWHKSVRGRKTGFLETSPASGTVAFLGESAAQASGPSEVFGARILDNSAADGQCRGERERAAGRH